MSLTETKIIDKIEILENGMVQVRESLRIMRGDEIVAQTFHRSVLTPGQDLTGQPDQVVAIANAVWTQEVVEAFQNRPISTPGN